MTPYNERAPCVAYHEAGHVLALVALGYGFTRATVRTMREALADATLDKQGKLWFWRGGVHAPDILPPNLAPEHLADVGELPAWQARAEDHAVVVLAGPVAQARYSKVRLATLLEQSADHGDRADADAVLSTWFGEDTPAAFDRALVHARTLVNAAEGWRDLQATAARLLEVGALRRHHPDSANSRVS